VLKVLKVSQVLKVLKVSQVLKVLKVSQVLKVHKVSQVLKVQLVQLDQLIGILYSRAILLVQKSILAVLNQPLTVLATSGCRSKEILWLLVD
jgi:hypothetical protein